jgi:ElaA protein
MENIFIKALSELTTKQLFDIYKLRNEIFIVEQNCVYQDVDDLDLLSFHVCLYDKDLLVAYCRIIPPKTHKAEPIIGRVVTLKSHRGRGFSSNIMRQAIEYIKNNYATSTSIMIMAQFYLLKFYQGLGFVQTSEVFLEDGIEHIDMELLIIN